MIAAVIAARSLRNSSKALGLAESESQEKRLGIEPYLIEARKVILANGDAFAAFAVSYTNRASLPNSLVKMELWVKYVGPPGEARQVLIQADESFPPDVAKIKCLALPANIPARSSTTGWFVFKLPEYLSGRSAENYKVVGYTAQGPEVSLMSYLLMDTIFYGKDPNE